jgi:protein-S-isoprenylcysteine O-methyltransferase Ste14
MTPLVLHNWAATALVFGPAVGLVVWEARRFRGDGARRAGDPTFYVLQVAQLAGLALAVVAARRLDGAVLPGSPWIWVGVGCAVSLAGVALRVWAIRTLGTQFTRAVQLVGEGHVVTAGPYRVLRHPSYTGALVMFLGIGIGFGNAVSLVVCPGLATVGYVVRIRHEERALRRRLGEPYAEYAAHTGRLVPGVW